MGGRSPATPLPGRAAAAEVSHWADIPLKFVIVGVDGCGTTSVRRTLGAHPEISFTNLSVHGVDEDFTFHDMGRRTLPLLSQVEAFGAAYAAQARQCLGLYNPLLWSEATVREMLTLIPHLRVVAMTCDPVDRFEKRVFARMQKSSFNRGDAMAMELANDNLLWFGEHLKRWQILFGPRVRFLHTSLLRAAPLEAFNRLAEFVGVAPFPAERQFHRYNSQRGRRTGMCDEPELLRHVQQHFAPEYEALEELFAAMGAPLPDELRLRQTRCDRPDELVEKAECHKDRCMD